MPTDPRPVTPLGLLTATLRDLLERGNAAALDGDAAGPALDGAFRDDLRHAFELAQGLDAYVEECTTPESPALRELTRRTRDEDWAARVQQGDGPFLEQEMLSGHVEGQVLTMLVHASRARRVLEVGMFTGYSALAMAEALPADGEVVACELDPYVAEFARRCFDESADGKKIDIRVGPALDTLTSLAAAGERFDLVFIDADKGGYGSYVEALLDADLLAPHALICIDNTLMQGQPWGAGELTANGAAIESFNRALADDPRVEQVLIPVRDGLTLVRRVA